MKTQKAKLRLSKSSVTELNDNQVKGINGGCQWSDSSGQTKTIKISIIKDPTTIIQDPVETIIDISNI